MSIHLVVLELHSMFLIMVKLVYLCNKLILLVIREIRLHCKATKSLQLKECTTGFCRG
jgi:hypothetical protein